MPSWIVLISRDLDRHLRGHPGCRCSRGRLLASMLLHSLTAAHF